MRLTAPLFRLAFVPVLLMLCATNVSGQRTAAPTSPAKKPAAAAPIDARQVGQLRKLVNQDVAISGTVARATKSSSGHQFLNFQSSELSVVLFKNDAKNFKNGDIVSRYKGKNVVVRGELGLYKNKLQIKLKQPSQIELAPPRTDAPATDAPQQKVSDYLRKTGTDTWLSPAGLKYTGRDPEGLTRVEHVLRHASDIPNRRGSHGVFDGGEAKTFQLIDEAWRLAKKRKTRPKDEGRNSTLTVNMGRRVGYLGGSNGKQKRNPPLKRVFIVLRTDTNEVVTAFPK